MENRPKFRPNPSLRLMDQVREVLRYHHYAYHTEQSYCQWILRYIRFHGGKIHPKELGAQQVERFLSNLTTVGKVSASTQRQALNAIVFLYREVLHKPLDDKIAPARSKRLQRPPTVLTRERTGPPSYRKISTLRFKFRLTMLSNSITKILKKVSVRFTCQRPWPENILMLIEKRSGNISSPLKKGQ